jgi:type IV secretion system protein VirB2
MKFLTNKNAFTYLALVAVMLMPEFAAAAGNPIGDTLCAVVEWFTGPVGGGIATLAIIIIGIGALMGKVSWGMAIIVGLGVAIIFGAEQLIAALGTDGAGCGA